MRRREFLTLLRRHSGGVAACRARAADGGTGGRIPELALG